MRRQHLNYIILHDGIKYYLFERLGKQVPFSAYNKSKSLKIGDSVDEILGKSVIDNPEKLGKSIPRFEIEEDPYEVIFND